MDGGVSAFEKNWKTYDAWYDRNPSLYSSERKALAGLVPGGRGLELGVGTGRFADPLSVTFGVDPAFKMIKLAEKRGVTVVQGRGEELPFLDESFHFVLIVLTLCFVESPETVLKEARRVLKRGGQIILGILNRKSALGRLYQQKKISSIFYGNARFYSSEEVIALIRSVRFRFESSFQTILNYPLVTDRAEDPVSGWDRGGFVAIRATKQ